MGTPFRAGLERSWGLSWISRLRNHHNQPLALGALPRVPLVPGNAVAFPLAMEAALWIGCAAWRGERRKCSFPVTGTQNSPEGWSSGLRWLRVTFGEGG